MKLVLYTKAAEKILGRMQRKRQAAIRAKVDSFARGEIVDLKKLRGSTLVRRRVGEDRVVIDDQTRLVVVIKVGPRGSIYKE